MRIVWSWLALSILVSLALSLILTMLFRVFFCMFPLLFLPLGFLLWHRYREDHQENNHRVRVRR